MTKKNPPANRSDLIDYVASQIDLKAHKLTVSDVGELVDMMFQGIVELATAAPYLQVREFGRFEMRDRKQRVHPTPVQGGEPVMIPARKVLWFTASPGLAVPA